MSEEKTTTHFGFETVTPQEKTQRVEAVFTSVARRYDLMNDLMSLGIHRLWKRQAIAALDPRSGQTILDLAGGTGDMTHRIAQVMRHQGRIVLCDLTASMLDEGRRRLLDSGVMSMTTLVQANAESLPFPSHHFDRCIISFGLRNVTHKEEAIKEMYRVLKPGGRLVILEFSKVHESLEGIYDKYSFSVLPWLGKQLLNDEASYRYLAESIRMHPGQETLLAMLQDVGFVRCRYQNLQAGIAAIHQGIKI